MVVVVVVVVVVSSLLLLFVADFDTIQTSFEDDSSTFVSTPDAKRHQTSKTLLIVPLLIFHLAAI